MGDTDLSFEALRRFEAIEARLDVLEGGGAVVEDVAVEEEVEAAPVDVESEESTTGKGRRRGT